MDWKVPAAIIVFLIVMLTYSGCMTEKDNAKWRNECKAAGGVPFQVRAGSDRICLAKDQVVYPKETK